MTAWGSLARDVPRRNLRRAACVSEENVYSRDSEARATSVEVVVYREFNSPCSMPDVELSERKIIVNISQVAAEGLHCGAPSY